MVAVFVGVWPQCVNFVESERVEMCVWWERQTCDLPNNSCHVGVSFAVSPNPGVSCLGFSRIWFCCNTAWEAAMEFPKTVVDLWMMPVQFLSPINSGGMLQLTTAKFSLRMCMWWSKGPNVSCLLHYSTRLRCHGLTSLLACHRSKKKINSKVVICKVCIYRWTAMLKGLL